MENSEHKGDLIPFSKELWETGDYELITRGGQTKEVELYDTSFPDPCKPLAGRYWGLLTKWMPDGMVNENGQETPADLMLRKKTKKVWIPLFKVDVSLNEYYSTKEECEKIYGDDLLAVIEVEL